ncbi:hypothetical protein BU26DRAFT_501102 [Trematosphaeria pertusa]|uniref:Uncharacterized protein n=1 Tax=Trematosphaeria pertusa TaxID=390896 RepID=A0A6A6IQH7_9PLEO|nr:uncharacterized protein BU26DRAFT_501102 [Trematosphaeria pertusa]KAF2252805.1 hypothetical protein BU26DRAFT_501102 [Trematosphaeria pertusa]
MRSLAYNRSQSPASMAKGAETPSAFAPPSAASGIIGALAPYWAVSRRKEERRWRASPPACAARSLGLGPSLPASSPRARIRHPSNRCLAAVSLGWARRRLPAALTPLPRGPKCLGSNWLHEATDGL